MSSVDALEVIKDIILYRVRPWILDLYSSCWCPSSDRNFSVCCFISHTWTEDTHDLTTVIAICLAVFIYDYFLTFTREVELVWLSQWNIIKVMFLTQRYLPIVDVVLLSMMGKWRICSRENKASDLSHYLFQPFRIMIQSRLVGQKREPHSVSESSSYHYLDFNAWLSYRYSWNVHIRR
jgi:hypothetical protein